MGTVAIHYVDSINRRAELGADLFPCYWGAGIISRLVERLKEAAFKELGLHRLEIRCMPDNIASVRIALKAGFTFEGTLRDYVYIPGKGFTDESVYRLLAPEYFSGSPASEE
ncbi:MAG TPA: GNAT family protein [Candidatus Mcinerneyibacteriales bacterium]|nr:GNAT family protein [Candidatus Mcinerneyibacteriales bacterium]